MSSSLSSDSASLQQWCDVVSEDLQQIAVLHDREVDKALIDALRDINFPHNLGLILSTEHQPFRVFEKALETLPNEIDQETLDTLAVDYADIYLNHSLHASPFESVWLDEDHLLQQEPMFEIRDWYKRYGLETKDWRIRSEDHLVLQLQFIAAMLSSDMKLGNEDVSLKKRLKEVTHFMDEHLLLWLEDFSILVAQRCSTDFYISTAILTNDYIQELRSILTNITGVQPLTAEEIDKKRRVNVPPVEEPIQFVPGVAESW